MPDAISGAQQLPQLHGALRHHRAAGRPGQRAAHRRRRMDDALRVHHGLDATYVKSQEGMAWKDALELAENLQAPFQLAAASNPSLLNQYPALARCSGRRQLVAKQATSTWAKNKKAAQTAATATPAHPRLRRRRRGRLRRRRRRGS